MPNAQQIALNLVAQLDQGNIQSQASQMASTMARAIEDAFEGLGQRIAATIVAGVRQGLQGSVELIGGTQTQQQIRASNLAQMPLPGLGPEAPMAPQPGMAFPQPSVFTTTQGGFYLPGGGMQGGAAAPGQEPGPQPFLSPAMRRRMTAGAGAVAFGAGLYGEVFGQLPGVERQAEASRAEMGDLSGRALMRGDIEGAITQQRLGGAEAMQGKAHSEEMAKLISSTVTNLVTRSAEGIVAGGLAGSAFAGIGAIPGAGIGLGAAVVSTGLEAYRGFKGLPTAELQNVQGQTEAERQRTMEALEATKEARQYGMQAFAAAQKMGGRELSEFMFGAARTPDFVSVGREADMARAAGVTGVGGGQVGMLEFGRQIGLGPEQVQATMQQMGGLGRLFPGRGGGFQSQLQGAQPQIAELMNLQAFGVENAPAAGMAFARGGPQTARGMREGFEAVKDLVTDMVSAGFDKAAAGKMLTTVAQQMQGLGSRGPAELEAQRAISAGAAVFGPGTGGQPTGEQLEFSQRAMRGFMGATTAGGGLMGAAGFDATRRTQQQLRGAGIRTGMREELIMQQFGGGAISEEAIMELAHQQGVQMSPEQARNLARQSQTNVLGSEQRMMNLLGPGAGLAAAHTAGARTDVEAFAASGLLRAGIQSPSLVAPRRDIGRQIPGAEPGGAETQALAGVNVAQITSGVHTLGTSLDAINRAFSELLTRIHTVSREFGLRGLPAPGGHAVASARGITNVGR